MVAEGQVGLVDLILTTLHVQHCQKVPERFAKIATARVPVQGGKFSSIGELVEKRRGGHIRAPHVYITPCHPFISCHMFHDGYRSLGHVV